MRIGRRNVGPEYPVYIVAELSANHNRSFEDAVRIVGAAKEAGADAVKLQTYTPDTITISSDQEEFASAGEPSGMGARCMISTQKRTPRGIGSPALRN